jgi:ABC-2 type transport system permease protein/oleandomycin transport system permease protein
VGLSDDLRKGLIDRFPLAADDARGRAGRAHAGGRRHNVLSIVVMVGVGLAVGFRFDASALEIIAGVGLALFLGYAFSWIFACMALLASSPESAQAIGFIVVFPLTFASSAFVPVDSMPDWLQGFAEVNPFTLAVDALRALWIGAPAGNSIWGALAWCAGLTLAFAGLAIARYRRAVLR